MELTKSAFDMLLARLNPDREEAGRQYELLRRKLVKFASLWNSPFPEELADEALNRTARKISEGEQVENLSAYVLRVAQFVHLEIVKREINQRKAIAEKPAESQASNEEGRKRCYRRCFEALPPEEKDLIVKYYGGEKPPDREKLSAASGKTLNSLRVTAFRIRKKLAACLEGCLKQGQEL